MAKGASNRLAFNVLLGTWTPEDGETFVDAVELDDASDELVRLAAHAHDAGIIEVTEGLDESHIQTQEEGEAALAAAQGEWVERTWNADGTANPGHWDGGWHVGNLAQYDLEQAQKRLAAAKVALAQARADEDDDACEAGAAELAAAEENLVAVDADIQERIAE